jgi:hypothetical protein
MEGESKSMLVTIILAFMAGYWSANGIPHYITGIMGQEHLSPLGKSAVVNLLEGWGSFIIGGIFWYFVWIQKSDPTLVYISAAIGAFAINLFHAFVWRAHPEFYKRRQARGD